MYLNFIFKFSNNNNNNNNILFNIYFHIKLEIS